jgi:hypothetical protein
MSYQISKTSFFAHVEKERKNIKEIKKDSVIKMKEKRINI